MTKTRRIRRSKRRKIVRMIIRFRGAGRINQKNQKSHKDERIRRSRRTKRTEEPKEPEKVIYSEDFKKLAKLEKYKN